ncbi:hypothetical protein AOLI_G00125090 [Acnodon oligacanthus]
MLELPYLLVVKELDNVDKSVNIYFVTFSTSVTKSKEAKQEDCTQGTLQTDGRASNERNLQITQQKKESSFGVNEGGRTRTKR